MMKRARGPIAGALFSCLFAACPVALAQDAPLPVMVAKPVRTFAHDPSAFTEGLFFADGHLFESTGREGQSDIREVALETGKVRRRVTIPPALFGEGIVGWGDQIISVTWRTGIGFRWNRRTFRQVGKLSYRGEGWGMTRAGTSPDAPILLSDGTPTLKRLDPRTFTQTGALQVTVNGRPLDNLNELEWVDGEILANVWRTPLIARIDPRTGKVKGWIDLSPIVAMMPRNDPDTVPNGIAWDGKGRRLFVTGKNWPSLFQIAWPPK